MSNLSEFWSDPIAQNALANVQSRGTQYWSENIYRYYQRGSGKLGQACNIELQGDTFVVTIKPIYSIQRDGTIHEYGQDIIHGIPQGPGKYSPLKGYRLKVGQFPGVPTSKFFDPWMAEFEPVFYGIVREEVISGMRDFVKEQLHRGA
jgi:hypothetical protein